MHVENNPDFKSVRQLAHDWTEIQLDHTDSVMFTDEVRLSSDRLIRAISNKEISGRWKGYRIFMNDSFLISANGKITEANEENKNWEKCSKSAAFIQL